MAKAKKERANKYEEKVSFEGTFEDLVKKSVDHIAIYKVGDKIEQEGRECIVIASITEPGDYTIPENFSYVVEDIKTHKKYYI